MIELGRKAARYAVQAALVNDTRRTRYISVRARVVECLARLLIRSIMHM